jgi:hypothetical protein
MDKLVDKLPDLCKDEAVKRSNKAVDALCFAYFESRQLIERFMAEPQPPRKKALMAGADEEVVARSSLHDNIRLPLCRASPRHPLFYCLFLYAVWTFGGLDAEA